MSQSHINQPINYCDAISSGFDTKIIKPADQHDLRHIKLYIKHALEHGVNTALHNSELINNKILRTPKNIFRIIDKILSILSMEDERTRNIWNIPARVFIGKNSHGSLVTLLGQNPEKYIKNPDMLLKDLEIYELYYEKKVDSETLDTLISHKIAETNAKFNEAFQVVINSGTKKDSRYKYVRITEFGINKDGNVIFSERANAVTKNIPELVHKIQKVLDDLILLDS